MNITINGETKHMRAVWFEDNSVKMIDQKKLPDKVEIYTATNTHEVAHAIREMIVRGAPAIGVTAAYGLALAKLKNEDIEEAVEELSNTRPTAFDLFKAISYMKKNGFSKKAADRYSNEITGRSKKIGEYGDDLIRDHSRILTHCNAGALAVVDWGTALSPIRVAHRKGKNIVVFVDETRPRLQGSTLTAWELLQEGIEHYIIADNASGYFMRNGDIDLVIVGADRIVSNGDFANKIGTYEKAVLAKENGIPFYVAAPGSTFDFSLENGDKIPIEERSQEEVLEFRGVRAAPIGSKSRNPAFDVTPARYVTGYITEYGIFQSGNLKSLKKLIDKDLFMRM